MNARPFAQMEQLLVLLRRSFIHARIAIWPVALRDRNKLTDR